MKRGAVFTARWPIEPDGEAMPLAALKRSAIAVLGDGTDLVDVAAQAGAVLDCDPADMFWRIDSEAGELVATGPAHAIEREAVAA